MLRAVVDTTGGWCYDGGNHEESPVRKPRLTIRQLPKEMVAPPAAGRSVMIGADSEEKETISRADARRLVEGSWSLSRALRIRADAVSVPTLVVNDLDPDNPSPVSSGPLYNLLRRPNDWFSMSEILSLVEYDLCTSENGAFLLLDGFEEIDGKERPTQIWRMEPDRVKVVQGTRDDKPDEWYVKGFIYDSSGGTSISAIMGKGDSKLIPPDRVVWLRVVDPFRSHGNQTVLRPAYAAAVLIMRAIIRNKSIHDTGVTGAGIVKPAQGSMVWTQEQLVDIVGILQDTVVGAGGGNRLGVVNRPDMEFVALAEFSPKDMQFTELIGTMDRAISQATGVPFPLIDPSEVILSNAKQARQILFSNTIVPQLVRIADALNIQLVDLWFEDVSSGVKFDLTSVPELADDVQIKWNVDSGKLGSMLDINDRVRRGELDVDVAREMLVSQIGITKEMAAVFILEPEEDGPDGETGMEPIALAKLIAEAVYGNLIPADVGQSLVDMLLGEVGIVTLRPAPPAPALPAPAPEQTTETSPAPAPAPTQAPPAPPQTQGTRPQTTRSVEPEAIGLAVRGSLEHQLAWNHKMERAKRVAANPAREMESALKTLRSAASRSDDFGSGSPERLTASISRSYAKAIEGCINASSVMYDSVFAPDVPALQEKWIERVAATAEWVVRQTVVDAANGRENTDLAERAAIGLACFAVNIKEISKTIPAERERGVVPRGWRPLTWLTQLDDSVRDSHAEIHGRKSEYDEGSSGHAWDVGDGFCQWPGFCSTIDEEAGCRCFVV